MARELSYLLKSIRRALWSFGNIYGERLIHERLPDGSHRFVLELRADEVHDDVTRVLAPQTSAGASVGAMPTEPTKPVKK